MNVSGRATAEPVSTSSAKVFQETLLRFSRAVAEGGDFRTLIRLFCQTAKDVFEVSGAYYWELDKRERLIAIDAEGHMVPEFLSATLSLDESAVANEAVRNRRTVYVNDLSAEQYPMAARFGARAMLAAPLVVAGEVIGVAVLLHDANPNFFSEDLVAKATILATQLGSMAEVARLRESSLEERERAAQLVEFTHALQAGLDPEKITAAVVQRVRAMFGAASAIMYVRGKAGGLETRAFATESLAEAAGADHAARLARAAESKLLATTASELPAAIGFAPEVRNGALRFEDAVAVRIRTAKSDGVLLVCFPPNAKVQGRDFRLLGSLANSAGLILANAELYSTTERSEERRVG